MEDTKKYLMEVILKFKMACSLDDIVAVHYSDDGYFLLFVMSNQTIIQRRASKGHHYFLKKFLNYKNNIQTDCSPHEE